MPEQTRHELLIQELKAVRKAGLHRLGEHLDELPTLRELAEATSGARTAEHVEGLLRNVYMTRSEGAQGTAIGILLGLEQGRRGANPTVLRQLAAQRLGYYSVDTFRKKPEANAIATFADLIESYVVDIQHRELRDDDRIEAAIRAIENLNARERWFADFGYDIRGSTPTQISPTYLNKAPRDLRNRSMGIQYRQMLRSFESTIPSCAATQSGSRGSR